VVKIIQLQFYCLLLLFACFNSNLLAQLPSNEEVMSLAITQKKATDSKDALPFTPAPGKKPTLFPGHYTSKYNTECLALCQFLQGRDFVQVALLLYKTKEGYWKNACWYYEPAYRVKVKDFNKDSVLEIILETRLNAGNRAYGSYKVISFLNQNSSVWYENNTVLGQDATLLRNCVKGKEVTKDVKVTIVDTISSMPCILKERTTIGKFNHFSDSTGAHFDYETSTKEYFFKEMKYIPAVKK
jgi:hypothetical protein